MIEKKTTNNYALFNKHLSKISKVTIGKFGSIDNIIIFLLELCECGHIGLAAKKITIGVPYISPLLLYKIINSDRHLNKCIKLAKEYAAEMAEAVLYDRAINGYEEVTLDAQGACINRKKKYCSKSLLEYLKANSVKYQNIGKNSYNNKDNRKNAGEGINQMMQINNDAVFEVEAYESNNSTETASN